MVALDSRFIVWVSLAVSAISYFLSCTKSGFKPKNASRVDLEMVSEVSFAFFLLFAIWHCLGFGPSVFFLLFSFGISPVQVLVSLACGAVWGY